MAAPKMVHAYFLERLARFLARHPRWMMAGALIYLISPIDLFPEAFVGPIGYIDDLVVLLVPYLIKEYVKKLDRAQNPPSSYETTFE
jgi:uncharacterized membrane protein YkvA (DUF1232 family)